MASTWSSLKIQLMGAGDESGTWGTVTNANLGTVIEEAITGSSNVTFASADVTLTLTDSTASQTARNLRLNLTGTSGGARNLIVPAIEKVYIVNNGLADAVTVKNSTGSGIAVPAGKTMYVFNNGTDVVDAITHLTSLTLGTPLAVAQGGTGSATATFSGANITSLNADAITSGTLANARTTASSSNGASTIVARDASGNFSANTITASLTGTASGNLTSASSLNASNISSGTLAIARMAAGTIIKVSSITFSTRTVTSSVATYDLNIGTFTKTYDSSTSDLVLVGTIPYRGADNGGDYLRNVIGSTPNYAGFGRAASAEVAVATFTQFWTGIGSGSQTVYTGWSTNDGSSQRPINIYCPNNTDEARYRQQSIVVIIYEVLK